NLVRTTADAGGGTVRLETTTGTFGSTGNNPRLFFTQINGTAPTTTNLIGGWAFLSNAYGSPNPSYHWAAYDTTAGVGVKPSTYTNIGAVNFTPNSTNIVNLNASGTATLEDSSTNKHEMLALRFGADADQTLTFADLTNDVLYIGSGGILAENYNRSRYIGTSGSGTRGTITAGPSSGATGTQELFFHIPQGTTYVYSTITDNGSAPVALVKDLGGTVQLEATNNTYSGGTYLYGGRINATKPGSLGTGPVLVKGGALQLNAAGATSSTAGIRVIDGSELYLASNIAYNQTGDRFYIEAGSTITAYHTSSTAGFASLTRVYTWPATADGQVYLEPGAIVRIPSGSILHGDIMTNMIKNLGTDADLFFNQTGDGSPLQYITVGAGTPWKGLSSSVGEGWVQGTIYANSDFWLQGHYRLGSAVALNLGRPSTSNPNTGSYAIINQAGRPINVFVSGQVVLNEDTPVQMSGDITFVITSDGYLQPNWANSFGDLERFGSRAKVLVQAGGTLDPGNYVPIYPYQDSPDYPAYYGKQYPLPSPVNTDVVVEAGGRFLINDASGIGST
ncbi:MAG TPA: hypothetical protein PK777_13600, partial [Thermoguttaceae bacterium]|nr:hypothetical protein [Thermoguttaceae bacterium]